jgi:hypothetical protein
LREEELRVGQNLLEGEILALQIKESKNVVADGGKRY